MIAYASVFLMKVATKWNTIGLNVDSVFVWQLLERMINLLKNTVTGDRHLLHHIAAGLEKMLVKSQTPPNRPQNANNNDHNWNMFTGTSNPQVYDQDGTVDMNTVLDGMILNNDLIYESFGMDQGNDIYDLLASQFSC